MIKTLDLNDMTRQVILKTVKQPSKQRHTFTVEVTERNSQYTLNLNLSVNQDILYSHMIQIFGSMRSKICKYFLQMSNKC